MRSKGSKRSKRSKRSNPSNLSKRAVALLSLISVGLLATHCPRVREPRHGPGLRAAACAVDVTPVVGVNHGDPIFLAGFGNDRHATGVHDPLWARGVVIESRGVKLALVTLDVVGYFYNEVETIRSLLDPALGFDSITVTSTHNHEGPDTLGLWGPDSFTSGVDTAYLDFVNDSVVDCIEEADARLVPAAIKFATGSTAGSSLPPWPDLVADGRILQDLVIDLSLVGGTGTIVVEGDPGPILNPATPSFQIRRRVSVRERVRALLRWLLLGGPRPDLRPLREVLATVVNFASHPESLGSGNTLITSDFPHFMREALEARYGGVAVYLSGDLGVLQGPLDVDVADPDTGDPVPRRTFEFAQVMGELLAARAAQALDRAHFWDADPPVEVETAAPLQIEVENPFFQALGALGVFGRRQFEAGETTSVESEAQVIRIGEANMVVTPNELDPQIGNRYRDLMTGARHRFIAGLGNDELGYQMPAEKFNPSCFLCFLEVLSGDPASCPLVSTLDCDTIFINNIGPGADPQLSGVIEGMIDELNP